MRQSGTRPSQLKSEGVAQNGAMTIFTMLRARAKITWQNAGSGGSDQCSIPNAQFSSERRRVILRIGPIVRSYLTSVEHLAIRHPPRMRIEHWELSIGQIPGQIQAAVPCLCIVDRATEVRSYFRARNDRAYEGNRVPAS